MRAVKLWVLMFFMSPGPALAAALTAWPSLDPPVRNTIPASLEVFKGMGTDSLYPLEVDQTDGALPIEGVAGGVPIPISGTIVASNPSVSATGAAVPADATYLGGINGGNLLGVAVNSSGDLVTVGAGTAGTPAGGVVSIQGVSGGTAVPVSGTFFQATQPVSGTFFQATQPVSGSGNFNVIGTGTAGTAATGVVTVQGIASMTPLLVNGSGSTQPVSGTVAATQSGTWNINNVSGTVSLPTGAATAAKQPALGVAGTASADVITVQGISSMTPLQENLTQVDGATITLGNTSMTASIPVTIANNQTAVSVTPTGTPAAAGRSSQLLFRNSYTSTNVTTSAYVQVRAATGGALNRLCVFDSSGSAMKIATGTAGSEVDQIYVPPGGSSSCYELAVASSTRIAIEALDVNATSGQIIITGLN